MFGQVARLPYVALHTPVSYAHANTRNPAILAVQRAWHGARGVVGARAMHVTHLRTQAPNDAHASASPCLHASLRPRVPAKAVAKLSPSPGSCNQAFPVCLLLAACFQNARENPEVRGRFISSGFSLYPRLRRVRKNMPRRAVHGLRDAARGHREHNQRQWVQPASLLRRLPLPRSSGGGFTEGGGTFFWEGVSPRARAPLRPRYTILCYTIL